MAVQGRVDKVVAGVLCRFVSDNQKDLEVISDQLKHHVVTVSDQDFPVQHIAFVGMLYALPVPSTAEVRWKGSFSLVGKQDAGEVILYRDASRQMDYYVTNEGVTICSNSISHHTICYIPELLGPNGRKKRMPCSGIFTLLLQTVLLEHARYTMHGAGIVCKEGGFLLLGESGAGKSTLCLDLIKRGCGWLGDDLVVVYEQDGKLVMAPLYFSAKLFNTAKTAKKHLDWLTKYRLPKWEHVPLSAVLYVQQTRSGASYVTEQTKENCLIYILNGGNSVPMQSDAKRWIETAFRISDTIPCYDFMYGDRALVSSDVLEQIIAS